MQDNCPILVGAGQITETVPDDLSQASSYADLAAKAAARALEDCAAPGLAEAIDLVMAVRTFEDSMPGQPPFGQTNNLPRAVARRLSLNPRHAVYESLGGHSPQALVAEACEKIHQGEFRAALLFGTEVIANVKAAKKRGHVFHWEEEVEGQLEDRGHGGGNKLVTPEDFRHRLMAPMQFYGLMENARRGELDMTFPNYSDQMACLLERFSAVAARNPLAIDQTFHSAQEIKTVTEKNPMMVSPYTRLMVSKDGVNQAAAVLVTSVRTAREMGIPEDRWVYLQGYSQVEEKILHERQSLSRSIAMEQAFSGALASADLSADQIAAFDLYSCFPIVVSNARTLLGIEENDPRPLTLTGGLAFFGGPGNNYTMHGIAEVMNFCRRQPGDFGLAYGNGGWMSKHAVGIYSTTPPAQWQAVSSTEQQAVVDRQPFPALETAPEGRARIEGYTVNYMKGQAVNGVIVGKLEDSGKRFVALSEPGDEETLSIIASTSPDHDPLKRDVIVKAAPSGNTFRFA